MTKTLEKDSFARRWWPALLLGAGLFALMYSVVMAFPGGDCDYVDHIIWTMAMDGRACLRSFYNGTERLWHVCVRGVFALTGNIWKSAALVTAAADTAAFLLLFGFFNQYLPKKFPRPALAALTAAAFVVSALYVPGLSPTFYLEKGAVNTWHNPTNIMVRPFAIAVFSMTVRIYNRYRHGAEAPLVCDCLPRSDFELSGKRFWRLFGDNVYKPAELVLYPLCILLSAYAKPSFLQFFAPAILIFLLIDVFRTRGKLLPFCIKLALAYVPAALIVLMQVGHFFGGSVTVGAEAATTTSGGIALYFIEPVFSGAGAFFLAVFRVLAKLLMLCAWPLFILCLDAGAFWRSADGRLSCLCLFTAQVEAMCLHETGSRANHGNFLWGFYLSVWMFWCAAVGRCAALLHKGGKKRTVALCAGGPLLLWHLASGIVYLVKILQSGQYLY